MGAKKKHLASNFPPGITGEKKIFFSLHLFPMVGAGGVVGPKGIRTRDLLFLKEKKTILHPILPQELSGRKGIRE